MPRFSANLGYLWKELQLPDAVRAARKAGFEAVEFHELYHYPAEEIREAPEISGLTMLGLNTRRGISGRKDRGLAAVPGIETDDRNIFDEAIEYAASINCQNIHVTTGITEKIQEAEGTFRENLRYATQKASNHGITILIELLNLLDTPGYHLSDLDHAMETQDAVNKPNLKIMFDCYHIQVMQGTLLLRLKKHLPRIGHIQFSNSPGRTEHDSGEINFSWLFAEIDSIGWEGYLGAEYIPKTSTEDSLGWIRNYL